MMKERNPAASDEAARGFDPTRTFVRVTDRTAQGFVEFDFAIGEPDLFVELVLGQEAFDDFCARNTPEVLPPAGDREADADDWAWRLADARSTRFR